MLINNYKKYEGGEMRIKNKADLEEAIKNKSDLTRANLSGVTGLTDPKKWLFDNFEQKEKGIIVYKAINSNHYSKPAHWNFKIGKFLEEETNFNRTDECGCGVNFGTLEWIYVNIQNPVIWTCVILWEDLCKVCVPYGTSGKARCGRLQLVGPYFPLTFPDIFPKR